ncbi:MAG: hypothetical protein CMM67_06755 [Rhodospirillaceae bacterium]|nr:hypothetical protein [Rhodospirillaceae bacterium]OUT78289.1 MAG: hypothetical protein CBB83_06940 [Rhodospirillaceae bacterium TMED23]
MGKYILIISIFLSSCAAVSPAPVTMTDMMALDGVAVVTTGKTLSDHVISYSSGKNCSTVRLQTGQNFCEEDDYSVPEEIYCYNSLGNVNCFSSPPPYGTEDKTVDQISGKQGLIR